MPITLPPISRRRFLGGSLAAMAGLMAPRMGWAADEPAVDPDRFALLSDTHIAADPKAVQKTFNMAGHLKKAVAEIAILERRPAWALVNGDLAFRDGQAKDYETFLDLVSPMREKGMPLHLGLGNHDHRERFWTSVPQKDPAKCPLEGRHITVIESPKANWILLDSLDLTNKTPGTLGDKQRGWLSMTLDANASKPTLVVLHHDIGMNVKPTGLTDTKELLELLLPRKHVKAIFFGHTHVWRSEKLNGMHLVNLPSTAYPFVMTVPLGWVDCHLRDDGMKLELRCIDPMHESHGQKIDFAWR